MGREREGVRVTLKAYTAATGNGCGGVDGNRRNCIALNCIVVDLCVVALHIVVAGYGTDTGRYHAQY